jgi:hypothetical protein
MPAPDTAQPASPWVVIQDFSKNAITVAVALIGFTVTFSAQLLGKTDGTTTNMLYASWGFALLAVFSGVLAHGLIVGYLKTGKRENWAVASSNVAFWMLFLAALFLAIFGYRAVSQLGPTVNAVTAVENAIRDAPGLTNDKASKWVIKSLDYNSMQSTFNIALSKDNSAEIINVTIDATGKIIGLRKP